MGLTIVDSIRVAYFFFKGQGNVDISDSLLQNPITILYICHIYGLEIVYIHKFRTRKLSIHKNNVIVSR